MGIQCRKEGAAAIITLPPLFTSSAALSDCTVELEQLRQEITWDREVRCLLIAGPEAFSPPTGSEASYLELFESGLVDPLTPAAVLARFDIPTIAVIEADGKGPGLELALACDLRVCSESSRFLLDHLTRGMLPMDGGIQRVARLVGRAMAMSLILLPEELSAEAAREMGLVHRIARAQEPLQLGLALAHGIAKMAPVAVRYTKEALVKGIDMPLDQGLRLEADLYFLLHSTSDRAQGITAYREKKSPTYEGR